MKRLTLVTLVNIFIAVIIPLSVLAQDRVTIMAYNIYQYASGTSDTTTRNPYFRKIIVDINPDILVGIEIEPRDDNTWAVGFLNYVLNYGINNDYSMGTYVDITDAGNNDNNVIYYKHSKFLFKNSKIVVQDGNHPTLEYRLQHIDTGYEIIIYGVHLSSGGGGGAGQRDLEADAIRALTDVLADSKIEQYFIAAGDFNFVNGSSEDAYGTLTDDQSGNGYFIDPKNGNFSPALYTYAIDGNSSSFTGRYDLILNSNSVVNPVIPGQVEYVSNSFVVAGNDGSPNVQDIFDNIPSEYKSASDHLPVYAQYDFGGVAPVELVNFEGILDRNNVELHWRTETEVNNYGFFIERSIDNSDWSVLGFVKGNGNSNSPKEYTFIDTKIYESGNYYYRLKQTDNDGTFEYSDIETVTVGVPVLYSLSQNYPNPFNPETRIDFTLPEKQLVYLRVYNTLGEMVAELVNEEQPAGSFTVTFDASDLPSGMYIYRLETTSYTANKKMTLLK